MKTLRAFLLHKRIWMMNILFPLLAAFLLTSLLGGSLSSRLNETGGKTRVALLGGDDAAPLVERLLLRMDLEVDTSIGESQIPELLKNGGLDIGIIIPKGMDAEIEGNRTASITIYHRGSSTTLSSIIGMVQNYEEGIVSTRMDSLGLPMSYVNPIEVREQMGFGMLERMEGGIRSTLPMLVFLFGFMGLIVPVATAFPDGPLKGGLDNIPVWDRLLGISLLATLSALLAVFGIWMSLRFHAGHPAFLMGFFKQYLSPYNLLHLTWMMFLSHLLWSAVLAFAAKRAGRFLGAFGIGCFISALYLLALLSAWAVAQGMGDTVAEWVAFVPCLNILAAAKMLLAGQLAPAFAGMLAGGLLASGLLGFATVARWKRKEKVEKPSVVETSEQG